jgi:hypothetical protein
MTYRATSTAEPTKDGPGREQQWEKIVGNVVDKRLLPGTRRILARS